MSVRFLSVLPGLLRPLILGGLALGLALPSVAQPVAHVYPAKFVCGYERGDVPLLSNDNPFPSPYEDLKPGNYATLINILNVDFSFEQQTFTPAVVVKGFGPLGMATRTLAPLELAQVGCREIIATLSNFQVPVPQGEVVEGYVTIITTPNDPLQVDTVFTFESKDAFEKHIVHGTNSEGFLEDKVLRLFFDGYKIGTFPGVSQFRAEDIAGSGAGGLGVGSSIDVERVTPRDIITTPGADSPVTPFLRDLPKP